MADNSKKQVPLLLSAKLYNAIAAWAEDDFRSVNGQIEYLLTECVRQRKKNGAQASIGQRINEYKTAHKRTHHKDVICAILLTHCYISATFAYANS